MDEHIRALGNELRRRLSAVISLPLNWRIIDALCTLEERESAKKDDALTGQVDISEEKTVKGPGS